ncbi:hypothetical protein FLAG1_09061 [Fusarium langsethiae]|uniref:Uncharacterized protein n=1 Tax=Fusarium langsethiae TaxID=179993 RepID=A0A0M9ER06_FUSLA|nr:hypothetical protein FLAG1_09061 [Fusarium langsethiae]GKU21846.1 unnamed protein product [Fusarium langsethiae]
MHSTTILMHVVIVLATMAWCETTFTIPPNSKLEGIREGDMTENKRVEHGYKVAVAWETDLKETLLKIYQVGVGLTYWDAEYDLFELATNNEDSVYWFGLWEVGKDQVARSQYVNVSAPGPIETSSISVPAAPTSLQGASSTDGSVGVEPTTVDPSVDDDPGLSRGDTAGITAGSILGGLLILSGVGWVVWRKLASRKPDTEGLQSQQQEQQLSSSETKSELPGDFTTHPSEYARSQPGLHEAP